jgi:hypothetical protein
MAEMAIKGRWQVQKTSATVPPGYFPFPGTVQDLLGRITGNVARDLFFMANYEPPKAHGLAKRSGAIARRLIKEVQRAQQQVVTAQGGWTCGKTITLCWQSALERLQEIENSRRAIYNPSVAPKSWRFDFKTFEEVTQKIAAEEAQLRKPNALPVVTNVTRKKSKGIPLLGSQILQQRHDENATTAGHRSGSDRPSGLEAPFREWADRQTKRSVGGAMGWFHGE